VGQGRDSIIKPRRKREETKKTNQLGERQGDQEVYLGPENRTQHESAWTE